MKNIILSAIFIVSILPAFSQLYDGKENSYIEIRTATPIENEIISYSAKITLSEDKSYNSYYEDKLKHRSFDEQIKLLKHQFDSIGIASKNIIEEKKIASSYTSTSKTFTLQSLTQKQFIFIESLNRGSTYVQDKKIQIKSTEKEEDIILKSLNLAKQKATFIAQSLGQKLGNIKYIRNSTDNFKEEDERAYYNTNDTYKEKYYMIVAFYLEDL